MAARIEGKLFSSSSSLLLFFFICTTMASLLAGAADAGKQHLHVECFGDSLTAGTSPNFQPFTPMRLYPYAHQLESSLKEEEGRGLGEKVSVHHEGFPGYTASELLRVAGGLRQRLQTTDVVVLLAGTNDLGHRHTAADVAGGVWKLHEMCHAAGAKTLALAIPGSAWQEASRSARQSADEANRLLREKCEQHAALCRFFDWPAAINYKANDGSDASLWNTDGLHMTEAGYVALGRALATPVVELLGADTSSASAASSLSSPSSSSSSSSSSGAVPVKKLFPGAKKVFPDHWGAPPPMQTRDYRPWPEDYGAGSGTVAKWIATNIAKDREKANRDI